MTPNGVAAALEKNGLTNEVVRGLDRLYEALGAGSADGMIVHGIARDNVRVYLEFLGRLHPVNVQQLGREGFLAPLSRAPRVIAFASQGENLATLRRLTTIGGGGPVPDVVQGLEDFFAREAALTPAEQVEAVGLLRELLANARAPRCRFPDLAALRAATSRAREVGLGGGLRRGLEVVRDLVADDVYPTVADEMLRLPRQPVTDVIVPGRGTAGPDVQITTPAVLSAARPSPSPGTWSPRIRSPPVPAYDRL